LFDVIIFYI